MSEIDGGQRVHVPRTYMSEIDGVQKVKGREIKLKCHRQVRYSRKMLLNLISDMSETDFG